MRDVSNSHQLFTKEEVIEAMKQCNFNKGVGPNGFDGRVLTMDEDLKHRVAQEITHIM